MDHNWPPVVDDFGEFLIDAGLQREERIEFPAFGNKVVLYVGGPVNVRVVSDRGIWFV